MRRVLYLWVPHLHTAVERLLAPGLAGQPVVVASGSFARGVVVDASPEAEALGAGVGQSWRHARRHAPAATFIPYEAWRYRPFTERIGGLLHELTPWVETLPRSEEEFFADLGAGSLEEGERLAREVVDAVRTTLGLEARAGLATGKLVARTAGRCAAGDGSWELGVGEPTKTGQPLIRPRSGHPSAPNSQLPTPIPVPPGAERRFLQPLSLDYLWDMQPEHRRRLGPLGLRTFGQLAAVPQRLLVGQFGPVGRWYRLLAAGIDARRVKPWAPHPTISSHLWVEEEEADLPLLDGYLELLARRISHTLVATGQYTRVISLVLETTADGATGRGGDGANFRRFGSPCRSLAPSLPRPVAPSPRPLAFASRHLKAPTNLPAPIHEAARGLLVQAFRRSGVQALGSSTPERLNARTPERLTLIAGSLETRGLIQLSLFGDPDRGPALRAAIARIQERFGEQAIRAGVGERWGLGVRSWGLGPSTTGSSLIGRSAAPSSPNSQPPTPNS
jgi:DNA polymerase IV